VLQSFISQQVTFAIVTSCHVLFSFVPNHCISPENADGKILIIKPISRVNMTHEGSNGYLIRWSFLGSQASGFGN
jgi:hypothetical protein